MRCSPGQPGGLPSKQEPTWKAQCGRAKGRESFQGAEVSELRSQDGQERVRVAKDTAKKPEGIQLERRLGQTRGTGAQVGSAWAGEEPWACRGYQPGWGQQADDGC